MVNSRIPAEFVTKQESMLLCQYNVGDRVELAPHTDAWMAGDRYGTVRVIGRFYLHVDMDKSGKTRRVVPENLKGKIA